MIMNENIQSKFLNYIKNYPNKKITYNDFHYTLNKVNMVYGNLQPWPTFISQSQYEENKKVTEQLFVIMKKIQNKVFNNDFDSIAQYYDFNQFSRDINYLKRVYNWSSKGYKTLVGRGDFIMSSTGLKLLEFNIATNVGGWQASIVKDQYFSNKIIVEFLKKNKLEVQVDDTLTLFFKYYIENTIKYVENVEKEINIFNIINPKEGARFFQNQFKIVLQKYFPEYTGKMYCTKPKNMFIKNDMVFLGDKRIHAIIDNSVTIGERFYESFGKNNVMIFNTPIGQILTNKLNMALLHDPKYNHVFSDEELAFIRQIIPYSFRIEPVNYDKLEDLVNNKNSWVIKHGYSSRGLDVFIGKEVSNNKWIEILDLSKKDRNWIAQEFVESNLYKYQLKEGGITDHNVIWGLFICGNEFSGGFLRIMPEKSSLIVNTYNGATESYMLNIL